MKLYLMLFAICLVSMSFTANETFVIEMKAIIKQLDAAKNESDLSAIIEKLKSVEQNEPDEWLPDYYIAIANLKLASLAKENEMLESMYAEAEYYAANALDQWPSEPELMILLAKIYIDQVEDKNYEEVEREMQIAQSLLENVINENPDNPRAYYLMGKSIYLLMRKMESNTEESCSYFDEALDRFNRFKPASDIHPSWGKNENVRIQARCSEKPESNENEERK